jgi:hypothetical protein
MRAQHSAPRFQLMCESWEYNFLHKKCSDKKILQVYNYQSWYIIEYLKSTDSVCFTMMLTVEITNLYCKYHNTTYTVISTVSIIIQHTLFAISTVIIIIKRTLFVFSIVSIIIHWIFKVNRQCMFYYDAYGRDNKQCICFYDTYGRDTKHYVYYYVIYDRDSTQWVCYYDTYGNNSKRKYHNTAYTVISTVSIIIQHTLFVISTVSIIIQHTLLSLP